MLTGRLLTSIISIWISILLILACTACGGSGTGAIQTTPEQQSVTEPARNTDGFVVQVHPQQPVEFNYRGASVAEADRLAAGLPTTHAVSYTADDLRRLGGNFEAGLPAAHVAVSDDDAVFSPAWDHADPGDGSGLAYCMYRFQLADYDELPTVSFTWLDDTPPVPTGGNINFWVGLANRETGTWDWYEGPAIDHVLTLESLAPYFDENNYIIVTVVLLGTTEYTLTYVMLGNPEVRNCGDLGLTAFEMAIPPLETGGVVQPLMDLSPACPPVRNQGRWFSCCAFAVGDGALNFELGQLYHGLGWDFEDVFNLVSPMYLYIESGNNLSFPPYWSLGRVTDYMGSDLVTQGIATEQNAPYNLIYDDDWSDEALADAALLHSASWTGINPTTPEGLATIKTVLVRLTRPVIVRLNIDGGFINYVDGIWDLGDTPSAGHTMLITGFDDAQSAFTVRNSFGADWGEEGYLRMSYDTLLNPEAEAWCWFLTAEYDDAVATRFTGATLDLAPPVGVQATQGTRADGVTLSWDAAAGATAYRIYRDRTTNLVAEPGAVTEWLDTSAAADTSYAYWVRQFDGTDWSGFSAPAIGWLGEDPGDVEVGEWTMDGHDVYHTGQSPFVGPYAADLLWTYKASFDISGTPVIDPAGVVYIGDWDGLILALNPNGSLKWSYQTGSDFSGIRSALALAPDGTVYAGNMDGVVYAVNPDGSLKWQHDTGAPMIGASPVVGNDGTIYVAAGDGYLYAINPDGTEAWSFLISDFAHSTPAIGPDGTIYVGGYQFHAINPDGTLKWSYATVDVVCTPTAIGPNGSIYFCVNSLREYLLIALNPDGTEQWVYDNSANDQIGAGPAVGANGTIYVGSWDNHLHAINPDGTVRWKYEAGGDIASSPAIGADGTVYVGAQDLYVHAINHLDGTLMWKYRGDNFFNGGPALGPDGSVYIGNCDDYLYAFGPGETVLSPPAGLQAGDGTAESQISLTWDHQDRLIQPDGYNIYRAEALTGPYTFLADVGYATSYDDTTTNDDTTYWYRASGYRDGYDESVQGTADSGYNEVLSGPGDWSMFGREVTHNRRSPANGPATNNLLWSFTTGGGVKSSPAITGDGTVYAGSGDGNLYAIYPDGTQRWACPTGAEIYCSPAIAPDGTVYVGNQEFEYKLFAIKPDGTVKWSYGTLWHVDSSPAIGPDGRVYFGCWDYKLRALNTDGTLAWEYETGQIIGWSSPALAADGTVYIGCNNNSFYAVNSDGTLAWSYAMGAYVESSPAIGADGTVYAGSKDDKLYALNSDGTLAWSYLTGGDVDSSPAIGTDGTVYFGSGDGKLYALNGSGEEVWTYATGEGIYSSPAIDAGGVIYFGSNDDSVYALNPDGTLLWSYATGGDVGSSPALGTDGRLYVGSYDGKLYAFGAE